MTQQEVARPVLASLAGTTPFDEARWWRRQWRARRAWCPRL